MAQSRIFMFETSILALALIPVISDCVQSPTMQSYGIGRAPTAPEVAGWNIGVRAGGTGLPAALGSVRQGVRSTNTNAQHVTAPRGRAGLGPGLPAVMAS